MVGSVKAQQLEKADRASAHRSAPGVDGESHGSGRERRSNVAIRQGLSGPRPHRLDRPGVPVADIDLSGLSADIRGMPNG